MYGVVVALHARVEVHPAQRPVREVDEQRKGSPQVACQVEALLHRGGIEHLALGVGPHHQAGEAAKACGSASNGRSLSRNTDTTRCRDAVGGGRWSSAHVPLRVAAAGEEDPPLAPGRAGAQVPQGGEQDGGGHVRGRLRQRLQRRLCRGRVAGGGEQPQ